MGSKGKIVFGAGVLLMAILGAPPRHIDAAEAPAARPLTRPATGSADVETLIARLGDPDPEIRQSAADDLVRGGISVRSAVRAAVGSSDPEIAAQSTAVLLRLPWEIDSDRPQVKSLLSVYGKRSEAGRVELAGKVLEHRPESLATMWRLLLEEPSATTRWGIAALLQKSGGPEFIRWFRKAELKIGADANSAALALAGHAWMGRDGAKSLDFFRRAIEIEADRPTDDDDGLAAAFKSLCDDASERGDGEKAAEYRRLQCKRRGLSDPPSVDPVFRLFALHADHGPLKDSEADLRTFAADLGRPAVLMSLARMRERGGERLAAEALLLSAEAASPGPEGRGRLAEAAQAAGWPDLAEREYLSLANRPHPLDRWHVQSRLMLFYLAKARDDYEDAGVQLRHALQGRDQMGLGWARGGNRGVAITSEQIDSELAEELEFLDFRAARARQDGPMIEKHLARLLEAMPTDADVLSEILPELRARGRGDEVSRLVDPAYAAAKARLAADPTHPQAMNELAWLCARCDVHLDEALLYSRQAIESEPRSSAYLDTAAEANYRVGNFAEAVRLETEAVRINPRDKFMRKQLEKFKRAASLGTRPVE